MGLDIRFVMRKKNACPHCGKEIAAQIDVDFASSGGRGWYPFLEHIGYYVPYEQRTEKNDWYGKDMVLTEEQADEAYQFAKTKEPYNWREIVMLIAVAKIENYAIVVNADW